jgi:uncharacterized paraquat-inducible protein A
VPWCDTCDRLVDDDELVEGSCPTCGTDLAGYVRPPISWKFRLFLVASVIYLTWRAVQGVMWLTHHA